MSPTQTPCSGPGSPVYCVRHLLLMVVHGVKLCAFSVHLQGMQLFGFKFASCSVPGSQQLPPPGLPPSAYPDCYIPCQEQQALSWIDAKGVPVQAHIAGDMQAPAEVSALLS